MDPMSRLPDRYACHRPLVTVLLDFLLTVLLDFLLTVLLDFLLTVLLDFLLTVLLDLAHAAAGGDLLDDGGG
jgi:hypothetical protein